jgi:hypothetical protein
VTSTIVTDGNGRWVEYAGGDTDMLAQRQLRRAIRRRETANDADRLSKPSNYRPAFPAG